MSTSVDTAKDLLSETAPGPRGVTVDAPLLVGPAEARAALADSLNRYEGTLVFEADWLTVVAPVGRPDVDVYRSDGAATIIVEGYFSGGAPGCDPAREIHALWRRASADAGALARELRGSFRIVIIDERARYAAVIGDRVGAGAWFERRVAGSRVFCSHVAPLVCLGDGPPALAPDAVAEFVLQGWCSGEATLFKGVRRLPQASLVEIHPASVEEHRYWELVYSDPGAPMRASFVDELDAALQQAHGGGSVIAERPALLLSGGLDSRAMLGYLGDRATQLRCVTCAVEGTAGEDHGLAAELAALHGAQCETLWIKQSEYAGCALREAWLSDGRVEVLDAPSDRYDRIAEKADGVLVGDECFGWRAMVASEPEATRAVGLRDLHPDSRIGRWFARHARGAAVEALRSRHRALVERSRQETPSATKDKLYYEQRLHGMLNGYAERRGVAMRVLRPLVDEGVIDVVSRLPDVWRDDKRVLRELVRRRFPELDRVSYAKRDSVPWTPQELGEMIHRNKAVARFIRCLLVDDLPMRLAEIVEPKVIASTVDAVIRAAPLPTPGSPLWRLPGLWRFRPLGRDSVHPAVALLRLCNVAAYLRACDLHAHARGAGRSAVS